MAEHEPCPFCGNEVPRERVTVGYEGVQISCPRCWAMGPYVELGAYESMGHAAIRAWELWDGRARE